MDVLRTELPYSDPTRELLQRDVVEHHLVVRPGQFVTRRGPFPCLARWQSGIPEDQFLTVNTHHLCSLLPQEVLFLRALIGHHSFILLRGEMDVSLSILQGIMLLSIIY